MASSAHRRGDTVITMHAHLQSALRAVFLRAEALLNVIFGDRLNPLYHLGAISWFLMWLIVGSGLYLYAFFETSVTGANGSVEALTHAQPWAGGLLRSIHRYASDALVLAMLLHMLRHWAFDRYRGWRWFSWLSGVALLWLVYTAGINGYMLPWDRLSRFVTVATAEWLDWLPIFGGTLVRNFMFKENVNDRLFSLLSFIHVGVPLSILAVLWLHTQRVPGAKTMPPAALAAGTGVSLVALSVALPALSQNDASAVALGYDWFYLPVLALLQRWTPAEVWLLVAGSTALLVLAPWLPPRRAAGQRHMLVRPDNRIIGVRSGETLLDAALREGIALPYDCRSGGCGRCKATLASGTVEFGDYQRQALPDAERAAGAILACACTPTSDVEIEYAPETAPGGFEVRAREATVVSLDRMAPEVMRMVLEPDGEPVDFYAGQYINVLLEDGAKRSFSFANPPGARDGIELHIRRIPGGLFTTRVFESMRAGDRIRFEGPLGSFFLREDAQKPIIFVAGSTGFAPVKSMLEYAFARGSTRRMHLYWGVRHPAELYLAPLPEQWAREHENFRYVPVISDPQPGDGWRGRTGLVHEAILADFPSLAGSQVYACGSTSMVEAAHPAFRARGLAQDDCFSDAFRASASGPETARLGGRP